MAPGSIEAVARMLVTLAACPEEEQLDVLAHVVRTWIERESPWVDHQGSRRLWQAARRV